MAARVNASVGKIIELSFVPDEHFPRKIIELLQRLGAESDERGHPRLASLIDAIRREAEDTLNFSDAPARHSPKEASNDGVDDASVIRMAEKLAWRREEEGVRRPAEDEVAERPEFRLLQAVEAVRSEMERTSGLLAEDETLDEDARAFAPRSRRKKAEKLKLGVEICDFDTERLDFSLAVLGGNGRDAEGSIQMTLEQMDVFLTALRAADHAIELKATGIPTAEILPKVQLLSAERQLDLFS